MPTDITANAALFAGLLLGLGCLAGLGLLLRFRELKSRFHPGCIALRASGLSLADAAAVLALMIGAELIAVFLGNLAARIPGVTDDTALHLSLTLQGIVVPLFTILAALALYRGRDTGQPLLCMHKPARRTGPGTALVGYLAMMPGAMLISAAALALFSRLGFDIDPQPLVELLSDAEVSSGLRLQVVVMALVGAPLFEEILFRGLLLPALLRHYAPGTAITAVSLLFALMHLHVLSMPALCFISAAFSLAYILTRSILVPVLMHVFFNAGTLVAVYLLEAG